MYKIYIYICINIYIYIYEYSDRELDDCPIFLQFNAGNWVKPM